MKLIIDIPDRIYKINQNRTLNITDSEILERAVQNGILLDAVKAEIADIYCGQYCEDFLTADSVKEMILDILDNIGKAESED